MRSVLARAVLLCAAMLLASSGVASAHTSIQSAEPGPGETVSGVVDRVVLRFLDPVAGVPTLEVRGPTGDLVDGLEPAELTERGRVAERRFAPLRRSGRYRVDYTFVAQDGAQQTAAHEFRFAGAGTSSPWEGRLLVAGLGLLAGVGVVLGARRVRTATGGPDGT